MADEQTREKRKGTYSKSAAGKARKQWQIVQRRRAVALLMDQGLEQKEIARQLGVSAATVSGDVAALKEAALSEAVTDVGRLVAREALALDSDEAAVRSMLADTESASGLSRGYETVLMIMRRRAELLGLDAQQRRKERELDHDSSELDELLARVLADGSEMESE